MKTILVPTDFSDNATVAAQYAAGLAKFTGKRVMLLHVYMLLYAGYDGEKRTDKLLSQLEERSEASMKETLDLLRGQYPDVDIVGQCYWGYAEDKIVQEIDNGNYSLVVMGTKGAANTSEKLLGSTTHDVVSRSRLPVLAVPQTLNPFKLDKLGYFTAYQHADMVAFLRLRHLLGREVETKVLHLYASDEKEPVAESAKWEERFRTEFPDYTFSFRDVRVTKIDSSAIANIAEFSELDLLVFTKPHRSFFENIFHRSLTKDVAGNLKVPSLFIPG